MRLSLHGPWRLRPEFLDVTADRFNEVLNRAPGPVVICKEGAIVFPARHGFMTANVPCDVITPLVENGIIDEPLDKTNTKDCLWIKNFSWWFIREFEVTEQQLSNEQARLHAEMLDFKADILINGIPVGHHKNSFVPFEEDIKRFLHVGKNQIIIRLTSGIEDNYGVDSVAIYCGSPHAIHDQRIYLRKPQFTYGWDWCQPVPTCGIGRDIHIDFLSGARITAFRADTLKADKDAAQLKVFFELDNLCMYSADDACLEYDIIRNGSVVFHASHDLYLRGGRDTFEETVTISNPDLWWPNGYGDQPLYTVTAKIKCRNTVNAMPDKSFGIRTLKLCQDKLPDGTRKFEFVINGTRIWCKGGNWVPTDSVYLRTPDSTYKTLVEEAKNANFTMLRIWGGGTYEPDCFYQYCSENGILLMHDFMYSCAFYPDQNDDFLLEATLEADYQTKRLAHFPCMAIWTGNNEIHESFTDWFAGDMHPERFFGEKVFNYIQPDMVRKNSPLIPYAPSTPFFAAHANDQDAGDSHVWKWLGRCEETRMKFNYELEAFDRLKTRFSSEYGFFGAQMLSTIKRYHKGEPIDRNGAIWKHHGEFDRKREPIDGGIERHLTEFSSLDTEGYLLYSGILQGMLYSEMATTLRSRSYCAGDLIWMYNDCWPETGWTIIDYYLTRKVSFYFLKRAFAPTQMIFKAENGKATLTVINETPEDRSFTVEYGFRTFAGDIIESKTIDVAASAHSWQSLFTIDAPQSPTEGYWYAVASDADFLPANTVRGYYRDFPLPKGDVEIIGSVCSGSDRIVTIRANSFVPVVYLKCKDDRTHMSDNYMTMLPGEERTIRIYGCTDEPELCVAQMMPNKSVTE